MPLAERVPDLTCFYHWRLWPKLLILRVVLVSFFILMLLPFDHAKNGLLSASLHATCSSMAPGRLERRDYAGATHLFWYTISYRHVSCACMFNSGVLQGHQALP